MNAARLLQHFERISEAPDAASTYFSLITGGKYYTPTYSSLGSTTLFAALFPSGVKSHVPRLAARLI